MMTPLAAARAYGAAIKQADTLGKGSGGEAVQAPDFGKMLQGAMEQTMKSTQQAEHMMVQQQAGQAELIDAVTAVSSAELQLQSVIAIRDQVISAYQEIMRMPI
ncbi:flagellar hook-basal body protein FliE [Asticcacaulis sp. AC460]|uniref:flagellar hook-basal body complex protein FliE n=1 Tax=Asticcacaulis sp. AC460 TaxID=1282360 RepID=UPI0003C3D71D|nr:flagellar hook-basal body complex protein FliE [Asticcacaulis sp. AC460]ESQ87307.1 flagellar hook-basal body protein FliE [Asticcacaulis sp. AC460]